MCSCLPWHEVFSDLLAHVSNCLNDAKKQSVFPLLGLLYSVQQFKSGELVSVADVRINEVCTIYAYHAYFFVLFEPHLAFISCTELAMHVHKFTKFLMKLQLFCDRIIFR